MHNAKLKIRHELNYSVSEFETEQKYISVTVHKNGEATIHFPADNNSFQMNILVYADNVKKEA